MYQALYRKYRPASFSDVVGQDVIVKILLNAIQQGKISHAYLFTGPRGTGKTSIAKIFAKTINCENLKDGEACNECDSCKIINSKQSTDVIEIDAASNNGVDEIRNLKSKITLVPTVSKYKVYIIDEVHMLSTGAFNALLKTLEEPPKHVVFILATTEPQKLPTTILSRCQRYDFKKISDEKIFSRLKNIVEIEKINIEDDAIYEIARLSDGGLRDSISLLDQASSYKIDKICSEDIHMVNGTLTIADMAVFIKAIFSKNISKVIELLDFYDANGKNIYKLIDEIIFFLRNLLIYKCAPSYFTDKKVTDIYADIFNIFTDVDIYEFVNSLNEMKINSKNANNIKTLLEIEIIKNFCSGKDISQEIDVKKSNLVENKIETNQVNKVDKEDKQLEELIRIRVDNTLSRLDKKIIKDMKPKIEMLKNYILDENFGKYAALLLDGQLKAASDEYLCFVFDVESDSELFNGNLETLAELINKISEKCYKVISVDSQQWSIIKDEFNNKKRDFIYKEEIPVKKPKSSKVKSKLDNAFDELLEYTEEEL